ncbi:sulfate permease [Marinomonas agarivorans]|nr:sulfate permease [Marinomonas agarivorans]
MNAFERWIPPAQWLKSYNKRDFTSDIVAGLVVSIMMVPQSLAYALLAGLPPEMGLYASILPILAYALLGSSRALSVGPAALIAIMTASFSSQFATPGTPEYNTIAILLALISGAILICMGVLRLGFLANLLSHPVISGFVTGSAIIIAMSQVKHFLGINASGNSLSEIIMSLSASIYATNFYSLAIGLVSLVGLFWLKKYFKNILVRVGFSSYIAGLIAKSGPVFVIILATLVVTTFALVDKQVLVVGDIPSGLPALAMPDWSFDLLKNLLPAAAILSLVGFIESVSIGQAFATRERQKIDTNNEFIGLGSANLIAGFSGGFAVTGSFSRSAVNFEAGAKSQLSGVLAAFIILLSLYFFTDIFYFMPNAVLAATIILAVTSLVDFKAIFSVWRYSKQDGIAMVGTIITVLIYGVDTGIIVGVSLSILLFLWHTSNPHIAIVGQIPGTEHYRNIERHHAEVHPKILTLRVDENLFFANCRTLEEKVSQLMAERTEVKDVVLMFTAVNMVDVSALESLESISESLKSIGVKLHLSEVKGPVMDKLKKSDFLEHLTGDVFLSQHKAITAITQSKVS